MLTRRQTLQAMTATAALGASPLVLRSATAATGDEKRLVVVLLRGGMDGLAAVAPYGDATYRRQRGELALPRPGEQDGLVDLDGHLGLHPALARLHPFFRRRELAIAVGYRDVPAGRPMFDAQRFTKLE